LRERVEKRREEEIKELLELIKMARETGISQERIKEILAELEGLEGVAESSNFSLSELVGNLKGFNVLDHPSLKEIVIQADKA